MVWKSSFHSLNLELPLPWVTIETKTYLSILMIDVNLSNNVLFSKLVTLAVMSFSFWIFIKQKGCNSVLKNYNNFSKHNWQFMIVMVFNSIWCQMYLLIVLILVFYIIFWYKLGTYNRKYWILCFFKRPHCLNCLHWLFKIATKKRYLGKLVNHIIDQTQLVLLSFNTIWKLPLI